MARTKVTFTVDDQTVRTIERTALRLGVPKSKVVREAVAEYAARADRLGEAERTRMLAEFDKYIAKIPPRAAGEAAAEIANIRRARKKGGRKTRAG